MSTKLQAKLLVISASGTAALAPAASHYSHSHGVHVGGDAHAAAIDDLISKVVAAQADLDAKRAAFLASLPALAPGDSAPPDPPKVTAAAAKLAQLQAQMQTRIDALSAVKWIGVVYPTTDDALDVFGALPGVFIASDRFPDALPPGLLAHVAHVKAVGASETGFSLARKLHAHYGATYFRPSP